MLIGNGATPFSEGTTGTAGAFFCKAIDKPIPKTLLPSIVYFGLPSGLQSEASSTLVDFPQPSASHTQPPFVPPTMATT